MSNQSETSALAMPELAADGADHGRRYRLLFINRSYWPDNEATGQLLTELAEDLADRFDVSVVVGRPNSNPTGESYRAFRREERNGVRILRVPHTRLPKGWLPGRILNFVTFLSASAVRATFCRRHDTIVVETDPFLLAITGVWLKLRHRARLVVYLQDIHPDVGIAVGRLKASLLTRSLQKVLTASYRRADRIVVLSEDMRRTMLESGLPARSVSYLPNWTDTKAIRPVDGRNDFRARSGIPAETFVVMYSGNLGVTQQLEHVIDAAVRLQQRRDLLFVFVGGGSAEKGLRDSVKSHGLTNVTFLPYQPKDSLGESLSAADLHLVTVHPRALAYLMPSKLYGILAAGRPVLAAAPDQSELANVVRENRVGFVVPPNNADAIARTVVDAADHSSELAAMGKRARQLAESKFDRAMITSQFGDLLEHVLTDAEERE